MRMLSPAYVVATVVIAVAGSAFAQSAARPAGTTAGTSTARTAAAPPAGANRTIGEANARVGTSANNSNFTSTTVTNADGSTTTTFSNGLVSNSGGIDASRSGNNTASSAANTATTSGTTASSTSSNAGGTRAGVNASANEGTTSNSLAGAVLAPGVVNPAIINGAMGGIVSDGERVFDTQGNIVYDPNNPSANANVQLVNNGSAGALVTTGTTQSSRTLDRAIKQAERDRKKIGRNGQLLRSIAPRTNVDRTEQMPDDGPTPALTGLLPR